MRRTTHIHISKYTVLTDKLAISSKLTFLGKDADVF